MTRDEAITCIREFVEGEECDRDMIFHELREAINTVAGEQIWE